MNDKEHSFIKQIKRARVTDVEKAVLCCALAEGKPFKSRKGIDSYIMALIHLEWRDFKEIRQNERARLIKFIIKFIEEVKLKKVTNDWDDGWNDAITSMVADIKELKE